MKTFDEIVPEVKSVTESFEWADISAIGPLVINRDLNGKVRIIVGQESWENDNVRDTISGLAEKLSERLPGRSFPAGKMIIVDENVDKLMLEAPHFALDGFKNIFIADRLVSQSSWASIEPETQGAPRIVFFSIKGGVGRSTALAATAWAMAQAGKRVLIIDLDLESPGLSSSILPDIRKPLYGVTDWLVEDLIDNGSVIFQSMIATSDLSHDGEIFVVPAHGADPGEYIAKLRRVWMPKVTETGDAENWPTRLSRLISNLEEEIKPDVILIDSRAGIDDIASSCVTYLGATLVLLFSIEGTQTWSGYGILFDYWRRNGIAQAIRDRLQVISALTPELDTVSYLEQLRESAYDLFAGSLYDEVPPGEASGINWHFETSDEAAPHYPWEIKWHRSFAGLRSLHGRISEIDADQVRGIFGSLLEGLSQTLRWRL